MFGTLYALHAHAQLIYQEYSHGNYIIIWMRAKIITLFLAGSERSGRLVSSELGSLPSQLLNVVIY
jgi:hypothetical protein